MVAVKGKGWVLAASARRAVEEADRIAPNRSRKSDGSIGDAAHASRESYHNPWGGIVDAVDITHDPAGGFDAHAHADRVVASRPDHLDHLISNRRIASSARGWVWREYTGPNPHDGHIHIANKRNDAGRNFNGPIFGAPQEDDMTPEQDALLRGVNQKLDWVLASLEREGKLDNETVTRLKEIQATQAREIAASKPKV